MVDLHSHALFGIDDGARTIEDSIEILELARDEGIEKMALTPHFTIGDDVEEFVEMRNLRMEALKERAEGVKIELIGGAEVYMTDEIFNETQLDKLTLGKSESILCEFKYHALSGETFLKYVDYVLSEGFEVLMAHPERYSYLRRDRFLTETLLERNVKFQVNAVSLFERSEEGEFARGLVENGIAYCIGSDVHRAKSRRLLAMAELGKNKWAEKLLRDNPNKLFVKD